MFRRASWISPVNQFLYIRPQIQANNLKQLKDACKELSDKTQYVTLGKCRELFNECNAAFLNKEWRKFKDTVIELLKITHANLFKNNAEANTRDLVRFGSSGSEDAATSGSEIATATQRYVSKDEKHLPRIIRTDADLFRNRP